MEFSVTHQRPEESHAHPRDYFTPEKVVQYATSKALRRIQWKITRRLVQLVAEYLPQLEWSGKIVVDGGCGPAFSTPELINNGVGKIVGIDIVWPFLVQARAFQVDYPELSLLCADLGHVPLRSNATDCFFSISALQWVFRDSLRDSQGVDDAGLETIREIRRVLKQDGALALQLYLRSTKILEETGSAFKQAGGITGGFIIDSPENPKKRKIFLVGTKKTAGSSP